LYAWEKEYTHPALSQEAANASQVGNYLQNQLGYSAGLNTQLQITNITTPFVQDLIDRGMDQNITIRSILGWMREGSELEDALLLQARSQHHFYDPIRNAGLDNRTDHPYWEGLPTIFSPFDLRGESALFWIITGTSSTGYPKNNLETWTGTKNKFYSALTSTVASDRGQYLAETFIALGHILHMLEDMGVPAHTRNDFLFAHYRSVFDNVWGNPLENWAENQVDATVNNNIPSNWLTGWIPQPKALDKISKYWDTGLYTGQYVGATPSSSWGLAEQTNYQFLSTSTVFGCTGTLYQFPQPTESYTTIVTESNRRYFQGYGVQHLARQTYTYYVAASYGPYVVTAAKKTITPDDDVNVYQDYVRVTVPRTIDYCSGLLNYFFRGRLSAEPNCVSPDCNQIELYITNDSNNSGVPQTIKGGLFELYWDDEEGTRAQIPGFTVPGWNSSSTLNYGQSVTGQFTKPTPAPAHQISKYILVYKGQINQNPADPDPDDPNAVAVDTFNPPTPQPHITNITPDMGCPGSVLLIEGSGFSATPTENTVSFEDVNSVYPDVNGTILDADSNGTWLTVELPYFDACDVDYYWAYTKVAVDGNVSEPYNFRLTNYIWCTIKLWDGGEAIDDEFDLYINDEYITTSYMDPPENPTVVEIGFWYEDDYHFVDTYLYESYEISGGTLEMSIEPYVDRVVAYRWNSTSEVQEFLYDNQYSGTFSDYFGSNLLVVPDDGIELDVYMSLTYTGMEQAQSKTQTVGIIEKSTADDSTFIGEARGKLGSVDTGQRTYEPAKVHKKVRKRMEGSSRTSTRNRVRRVD